MGMRRTTVIEILRGGYLCYLSIRRPMYRLFFLVLVLIFSSGSFLEAQSNIDDLNSYYQALKYRNIGPFRGGRSVGSCGVIGDPLTYYMGTTGGGLWKTTDAGQHWYNISDGYFKTGSVGAVAVAPSDANVVYAGMGEHAPRGVMTTYGDGVYRSTDAGKTWEHQGLAATKHIAGLSIHPGNPDIIYVAAQGALYAPSSERGVYKSADGGQNWEKVLYVDDNTGCSHLIMDPTNPRILYAAMWQHQRLPWQIVSGGPGSGIYKSVNSGKTWERLTKGLPNELGKISLSVSAAKPDKVYALIESDSEKEQGGLYVSEDAGTNWSRISKDHRLVQRAWYYIEVFADPNDANTVYVLNAPALKSIDGGKTWTRLSGTHGDYHDLWINPQNSQNMVISNDGGAAITFNGGETWSRQSNMPTAQFYRLNVDNHYPYRIYAGQQDNSSVRIASANLSGRSITERDWTYSAGGESAFLAFDPFNPRLVLGGSYQGTIEALDSETGDGQRIMAAPYQYLAMEAKDMKYRFNWNAPIIWSKHQPKTFYHGANVLLKTQDGGQSWEEVSLDLTRNDDSKQGKGGAPYTNEGAGGENYGTLSYVVESPHEAGTIYTGSDDGLVYITRDYGQTWDNITPEGLEECLINAIEVSPHSPATVYIATTRYKFNDNRPGLYKSTDYGKTWIAINNGLPAQDTPTRVIREDGVVSNLLYVGTEHGIYCSFSGGQKWTPLQLNLPITPITDLRVHHNDLIVATQGRSFWILDDLELVRQYNNRFDGLFHVFTPPLATLTTAGSSLNSNTSDGTDVLSGVNPASGMVIYYDIPASQVGEDLTLQIEDGNGEVIRTFSSEADTKFQSYPGGPDAEHVLTKNAGLNRFMWNLRHPTLLGAPEAYIEGSYSGHRVLPGIYLLRLILGEEETTNYAIIETRSDVEKPEANVYKAQDQLMRSIAQDVNEMHTAVNELQAIKKRLSDVKTRLAKQASPQPHLAQQIQQTLNVIDTWDGIIVQRKSRSYDDVINFPNKLSAEFLFLKGQLDNIVPIVSEPMQKRYAELSAEWQTLRQQYETLLADMIAPLEKDLMAAGFGVLR